MADINVVLPMPDPSNSVEYGEVTPTTVATGDEVTIKKALENKNNTLQIVVKPSAASNVVIKAGNRYPNSILGDLTLELEAKTYAILLEDISRFETTTGDVVLTGLTGDIYAVAKRAGLDPTYENIYNTDKDY